MAVTLLSDGVPVTVDDRLWMFNSTISPVAPNAYISSINLDPDHVWRTQRSVRTVVGFLARNIAQVNIHAFEAEDDGDRDRLPRNHELSKLLRQPSPTSTAYGHMRNLVIDVCMWERHASRFTLTADGPTLVRIPPRAWKFKRDALGQPTAICTAASGDARNATKEWPLDDFLWIDGYPCDDYKPLEYLAGLLAEEQESQNYRIELWRGQARAGGWIERPSTAPVWSDKAKTAFRTGWQKFASEGSRVGETPILEDDMLYHELEHGITPESAQQLEARKFSLAEAGAAFYVPPVFVGLLDYTSHSNVSAYRETLYSDTLGPWFQQLQQAYNAWLVPRPQLHTTDMTFVEFNVAEKLKMSFEEQIRILQTAVGAPFMERNEARQRINLKHLPEGEGLIVPLNVIIGGQASPTDVPGVAE